MQVIAHKPTYQNTKNYETVDTRKRKNAKPSKIEKSEPPKTTRFYLVNNCDNCDGVDARRGTNSPVILMISKNEKLSKITKMQDKKSGPFKFFFLYRKWAFLHFFKAHFGPRLFTLFWYCLKA